MQKPDSHAFGAFPRLLVDEANAFFLGLFQCFIHVVHGKSQMVNTLAFVGKEFTDGSFRVGGFEQLYLGLSYHEEGSFYFLISNLFHSITFQPQHIFIIRNAFFEAVDGNSYVFDMSRFHSKIWITMIIKMLIFCKSIVI